MLRDFAVAIAREEERQAPGLESVDWDSVLAQLVRELERRPDLLDTAIDLAWQRGTALVDRNQFREAREVLAAVAELAAKGSSRLGWIHTSLAQLEFAEEHWIASRGHLDAAEGELRMERVTSPPVFRDWLDSLQAEYWIHIGMPELARAWIERLWEKSADDSSPAMQWKAFDVRLQYLLVANDYSGLRELEASLQQDGWLDAWTPRDRERARMRFALGLVEQGLQSAADNARALERLEAVLGAGLLPEHERAWALVAYGLAALDGRQVERAASAAARLREVLTGLGTLDLARPENTVAPRLIALEGLVTLAKHEAGRAAPGELTLRLAEAQAAWTGLRSGWANAPTRDGGIGYLFLSQRQILIEALIGLQRAVLGEEAGAQAALQWLVEAQSESTLARRLAAPELAFEALRARLLDARTGLVAWIPLRSRSFALAADGSRTRVFELPGVDRLEARARDLTVALQSSIAGDDPAARRSLEAGLAAVREDFLPDGLAQWIEGLDGLYLSGLDDAGFVPFEMLPAEGGASQGARRALCRLPSLPVGLVLQARGGLPPTGEAGALVLIADRPDPERARARGVADLRASAGQVQDFLSTLDGADLLALQGPQAGWQGLVGGLATARELVHVLGHGVQRAHERPPGILLASDPERAEVFAEDIEGLRAPRLVLLSVCGAARSRLRRGDAGRSDLTAAFFVAGAAAVAASSADLDLGPTLRAGTQVHEGLARGETLAQALRTARAAQDSPDLRLGRDWIAAHALQVHGAGLTTRLRAAPGVAKAERGALSAWWPAGLAALALVGATLLIRRGRRGAA